MSEEKKIEEEEDEGNVTSPEKCENEEIRNFQEEPGDDDGENRHPTIRNSMLYTALLVVKGMIGAGILNLPLIFKTFGILGGTILTIIINIIAIFVAYLLGRSKELTQRYSFAVYSKLVMGATGAIIMKLSLVIMCSTLAIVQLIVFGDVFKGLSLLFCNINVKILIIVIALILLPFMFQKDISRIAKYAFYGIMSLGVFYITTVILFINKYYNNKIIFNKSMLYPNGTFKELFECVGGYYNAFTFHMAYFNYYLPLKPRNTKTMMKSVIIGTIVGSLIYASYGSLFFLMYGNRITDSAMKYLQTDLEEANKNNEKGIVFLLVICFLSFILNACISTMTHFFIFKSHFLGVVKFFLKKLADRKKNDNDKKEIPLVEIKEDRKFSDDVQSITTKDKEDKEEELLSERKQFVITFACYVYVMFMAVSFERIIALDSFNGSTVANYINLIAPSIFYLYFSRGKNFYGEKFVAWINLIIGVGLILLYFILPFF
jgi:amino acid permease